MRCGLFALPLEHLAASFAALGAGRFLRALAADFEVVFGLLSGLFRHSTFPGRRQIDPGTASLGQSDCDRLLWRSCAVLTLAYVLHFLADEFTSLRARGFPFSLVLKRSFYRFLFGHIRLLLP
jgi:hypothetical protein